MIHLSCVFAAGSWGNSVYNGPLAQADEFWESDKTTAAFRDYARAVVARWGASPSVFSWQLFNEMDGALGGTSTAATQWMANMTQHVAPPLTLQRLVLLSVSTVFIYSRHSVSVLVHLLTSLSHPLPFFHSTLFTHSLIRYIKSIDAHGHLVDNSFAQESGMPVDDALSSVDFTTTHAYEAGDLGKTLSHYSAIKAKAFNKPTYVPLFAIILFKYSVHILSFFYQTNKPFNFFSLVFSCVSWHQ
jgi:hypothetical protein